MRGECVIKRYFEPNRDNSNNYMFDTSAYNYIVQNLESLNIMKKHLLMAFATIQVRELSGEGAKTYDNRCIPIRMKPMESELLEKFSFIDEELSIKLVPEVASGMRDHTRVDGTNRFVLFQSLERIICEEISKKNRVDSSRSFAYSHDTIIAEVSVHYGVNL